MSKKLVVLLVFGFVSVQGAKMKCGSSTSSKTFTLSNPDSPPNDCIYNIKKSSSKICQLRIDFQMTLAPPTIPDYKNELTFTQCIDDYLEIGGYRFCGTETNQHIYIPFDEKTIPLTVSTRSRSEGFQLPAASWNIDVKQLECPNGIATRSILETSGKATSYNDLAPAGCLQYFPESSGTITSFNFQNGDGTYNGGLSYAICLQRTSTTNGVRLTGNRFRLGYNQNVCHEKDDFLNVPFGIVKNADNLLSNMFCGSKLNKRTVESTSPGPIVLVFHSGVGYKYNDILKGFSLDYELF